MGGIKYHAIVKSTPTVYKKGRHKRRPYPHKGGKFFNKHKLSLKLKKVAIKDDLSSYYKGGKFEMDRSKCPVAKILVYINSK